MMFSLTDHDTSNCISIQLVLNSIILSAHILLKKINQGIVQNSDKQICAS